MKLFVVDPQTIYRRGLVSCLASLGEIDEVLDAATVPEALKHPSLHECSLLLLDYSLPRATELIRTVRNESGATCLVLSPTASEHELLAAIQAGAVGYLTKESLTPETLTASVRAAASGAGVMAPELLGSLLRGIERASREVLEPRGLSLARLSAREQEVLRLVAEGHPTREVARRLSYSERTIKNVLHDVTTKLNARTRSQAVAAAVREGLI